MDLLVVEDQAKMRDLLCRGLAAAGYRVDAAADGIDGLRRARQRSYDAVVLDVMLPRLHGYAVVEQLRNERNWVPVLLLTARDTVAERVFGLDAGADDYLVKPFAFSELLGRLRALLRREEVRGQRVGGQLRCGPLVLDPASHVVFCRDEQVDLSRREFALLEFLLRRLDEVVPRSAIVEGVWGPDFDGASNIVDVYVKYLRDKIDRRFGLNLLQTVRGLGYRLTCPPS